METNKIQTRKILQKVNIIKIWLFERKSTNWLIFNQTGKKERRLKILKLGGTAIDLITRES